MNNLAEQIRDYNDYHQKKVTKYTHFLGVPILIFSLIQLFTWMHFAIPPYFSLSFSWILSSVLMIYYLWKDLWLGVALVFIFIVFNLICAYFMPIITVQNFIIFTILFILGIFFQAIGHFFEGKKPAFMDNLWQIIIAPLAVMADVFFICGYYLQLKERIENVKT